jgi:hypothetical protein
MKKLLFLILWIVSVSASAQLSDKPYTYPIRPGSELWKELTTSKQMDDVCVVPDDIILTLSTKGLLLTCLDYPRLIDVFCSNSLQAGFDFQVNHFNGLKELYSREDIYKTILEYYAEIDIQKCFMRLDSEYPDFFQVALLELMLAQDEAIKSYDENEKSDLLYLSIANLEKRREKKESIGRQVSTAHLLSRILEIGYPESIDRIEKKEAFDAFTKTGIVLDTAVIDEILEAAKTVQSLTMSPQANP